MAPQSILIALVNINTESFIWNVSEESCWCLKPSKEGGLYVND